MPGVTLSPPMSLLAELTHRCPLQCPYCSNPLALDPKSSELSTADWKRVLEQAAAMGVLQAHFSGGEPMARPDLVDLVRHAVQNDLYTNLITSGILLDAASLTALADAGLDHIQLSFQDADAQGAERIGGMKGAQDRKLEAARLITDAGVPLTLNFVVHRLNVERVPDMIALAETLCARRVEIAHTQYYGWGLRNRTSLMPTREQLAASTRAVEDARSRLGQRLAIDYVTPDYYADRPKPCMGGWGNRFLNITPSGRVLPCHAAETIPGVTFPNVRQDSLSDIWNSSELFMMYRGTEWMPEACRSCAFREEDFGGCRCQALALAHDAAATDPICSRSPARRTVDAFLDSLPNTPPDFTYRRYGAADSMAPAASRDRTD